MPLKRIVFTLFALCYALNLCTQNWIPRLNKNGTYSLVTEKGKLVSAAQYDFIQPLLQGSKYTTWISGTQAGCILPNKISITYEKNNRIGIAFRFLPVIEKHINDTTMLEDFAYLIDFSKKNLLVNLKTGKYIEDQPNGPDSHNFMLYKYYSIRHGLMKIRTKGKGVNFVDQNFNTILPKPIWDGYVVTPNLFIVQDSTTQKYGLLDAQGNMKLPFIYKMMYMASTEKHIVVAIDARKKSGNDESTVPKYGLIDFEGQLVLDTIYKNISVFENKFYVVRDEYKSGVFNQFLAPVIPLDFQKIEFDYGNIDLYKEKYMCVLKNSNNNTLERDFILLDSTGSIVFRSKAKNFRILPGIKSFYLELHNGETEVYSVHNGVQFVFRDTLIDIKSWNDGNDIYLVKLSNKECRLITRKGEVLSTYPYYTIYPVESLDGNYVAVNEDGKEGIITPSGEVIAPIIYDAIYEIWKNDQKTGVIGFKIDKTREFGIYNKALKKWVLFPSEKEALHYLSPPEFQIYAGKNKQFGVVRMDGTHVIPEHYQRIIQFENLPLFACYDKKTEKWRIVKKNNHIVFTFDKSENHREPVLEVLESTGDYAIRNGESTLFLKKDTFAKLSYVDLLYIRSVCVLSRNLQGWTTMFKPDENGRLSKEIWVNYYIGKVYLEK